MGTCMQKIIKQGISVMCIIKFEYKSISHSKLLDKDYYLPLISPLSLLTLQTLK
jgi:hypothetical protein